MLHIWLKYQGKRISTLDLIGENFVLFTGEDNSLWRTAARHVSSHLGVLLMFMVSVHKKSVLSVEDSWEELQDVTHQGAVLIRPDGFVA